MLQLILFLLGSAVIVYVSRASLFDVRAHGLYRFFAWEWMLGLILLNGECWFCDPFAWHQIISWVLLIGSLVPVVLGVQLLRNIGKPSNARTDAPMLDFEKTTALVTTGIYQYIRHPLYSSLLLLTWGVFFKLPALPGILLALAASLCLTVTAKVEEAENTRYFGDAYQTYMRRSKMFIPFLF